MCIYNNIVILEFLQLSNKMEDLLCPQLLTDFKCTGKKPLELKTN